MILGIDYGTKRIGLAMGDKKTKLALPYKTLSNDKDFFNSLKKICEEEGVEEVVVGTPIPFRGEKGKQIERVDNFILELESKIKLPIKIVDEKLTTREVENRFENAKKQLKKADKDAIAASIILQSFLDRK